MATLQDGIGGKAKAISATVVGLVSFLIAMLFLVPYELKMDSTGKLVPQARRVVYAPTAGQVMEFKVEPGSVVHEGSPLAVMWSSELLTKLHTLSAELKGASEEKLASERLSSDAGGQSSKEQSSLWENAGNKEEILRRRTNELREFIERNNANSDPSQYGWFYLKAPSFTNEEKAHLDQPEWTVLSGNFKDEWHLKFAKPSDPVLKLGAKNGRWEIELRIPQKHISQVLKAYEVNGGEPLDVDFLLRSDPAHTYRGKLYRDRISSEAIPNRDEKDESEPEVIAYVSIDDASIPDDYRLSREALTSGTEVRAKVRCGKHKLGYALFYGVWEFLYEKVVFFF